MIVLGDLPQAVLILLRPALDSVVDAVCCTVRAELTQSAYRSLH